MSTVRKGRDLQRRARALLESRGWLVEMAWNSAVSIPDKRGLGQRRIISAHHDFFGIWDAVIVSDTGCRGFVQVTTLSDSSTRRKKILASGFPVGPLDLILAHVPRTRSFRVLQGPDFALTDLAWTEPPRP